MTRAAIYVRISRDREGAGLGVARQEQDCRQLAATHGWSVVTVHADNDLSAYSGKPRPGYRALLDQIGAGLVDVIVAWHTDRLHRSPTELESYIALCDPRGVATHTVKAGPLDLATPSGRMVARQLGAVARYEVEHAIERQQRAKLQAATDGRWKGGRRPYGYDHDGVSVVADEAAVVRELAAGVLAGASLRGLAAQLNRRGLTTSTGSPWRQDAVRRLLLRPRNAGLMEHRGQIIGPAGWPALLPEDQWRAVVAVITAPGRRSQWSSARTHLLSGLARCGVCGAACVVSGLGHRGAPGYRCREAGHVVRRTAELEEHVTGIVLAVLGDPAMLATYAERRQQPDTAGLHAERSELRGRLDGLAAAYGSGDIDARQLREGSARVRERLTAVDAALAAAGRGSVLAGFSGADVADAWAELDLDRKRAIIDALMTITLLPSRRGRRPGWRPGESYFDPASVRVEPRTVAP